MTIHDGYPFIFQMNDYAGADELLQYTVQYRFKSLKSNRTYIVRAERYVEHAYCVKFFDKANMLSDKKFSLRTGTFEPRRILMTVFNIMLDIYKRDPKASFFFVGETDEKDKVGRETRRFRIYYKFTSSTVSEAHFLHYRYPDLSLYVLVNQQYVDNPDGYASRIYKEVYRAFSTL